MKQTDDLIWRIYFFTWYASDLGGKSDWRSLITAFLEQI